MAFALKMLQSHKRQDLQHFSVDDCSVPFQVLLFQQIHSGIEQCGDDAEYDDAHNDHIQLEDIQVHCDTF